VVVVEAAAKSGALNTARQALDEGRDVWAVPGSILSEMSLGPNALLRLGARPLVVPSELVRELGARPAELGAVPAEPSPVLEAIPSGRSLSPDAIAVAAGLGVGEVLTALLELELEGLVARLEDGSYARR
jgi:DNA processing protein